MFAQDDKQSAPAALEHRRMNSDEVRVNIRRVLIAEMMNVAKARTRTASTHVLVLQHRPQALAPAGDQCSSSNSNSVSNAFGNAELLRVEQWRRWLPVPTSWNLGSWFLHSQIGISCCVKPLKGPVCEIWWTLVVR